MENRRNQFAFEPRTIKKKCRCGVVFVRRSASHKYCSEKCRDEAYTKEAEMKKAARREQKERRAKQLLEEAKQQVVKALEINPAVVESKPRNRSYKKRTSYSNNTPAKPKNPRAGKRPCGNCRVIFDSVDKVNNQRCAKCRALAESASGMREFKVGR